jgi:diadenylate cyclase
MDSRMSSELVGTIFHTGSPLHDGGMIVRITDERIAGAGCVFPLNQRELPDRSIGLRHRASMGITEESDAIALVVSEETGSISIGVEGELMRNLEEDELRERLGELLLNEPAEEDGDDEEIESRQA